jgi:hypothetical protein
MDELHQLGVKTVILSEDNRVALGIMGMRV